VVKPKQRVLHAQKSVTADRVGILDERSSQRRFTVYIRVSNSLRDLSQVRLLRHQNSSHCCYPTATAPTNSQIPWARLRAMPASESANIAKLEHLVQQHLPQASRCSNSSSGSSSRCSERLHLPQMAFKATTSKAITSRCVSTKVLIVGRSWSQQALLQYACIDIVQKWPINFHHS